MRLEPQATPFQNYMPMGKQVRSLPVDNATRLDHSHDDTGFLGVDLSQDGQFDESAAALMWGNEPTNVHEANHEVLTATGKFGAVLNSAVDQIYPMFPNNIVDGIRRRDLHPDILSIASKIESIVFEAIDSEFMEQLAVPLEQGRDGVIKLAEEAAMLLEIHTSNEYVRGNIEQIRLKLKLLGHIVGQEMIKQPHVSQRLRMSHGRYLRQQFAAIDAEYADARAVETQRRATQEHMNWLLAEIEAASNDMITSDIKPVEKELPAATVKPLAAITPRKGRNTPANAVYLKKTA